MSSFVFRTNQGKAYTANTYFIFGKPAPVIPSAVSVNGLPTLFYPFSVDILDYANNTTTGVNDTTNNGTTIDTTHKYKTGVSGSLLISTTNYLTLPTFTVGTNGLTMAMWFYPTVQNNSGLFGFYASNAYRLVPDTYGGTHMFFSSSNSDYIAPYTMTLNTWVHMAWVYPSSSASTPAYLYINGGSANGGSTYTITSSSTYSGWTSTSNYVGRAVYSGSTSGTASGNVNNFYFFNRPLSQTEITALYQQ